MGSNTRVLSLVLKLLGGGEVAGGVHKVTGATKELDKAGHSAGNNGLRSMEVGLKRTHGAALGLRGELKTGGGMMKKFIGIAAGFTSIYGIKSFIDGANELGHSAQLFSQTAGISYQSALVQSEAFKVLGISSEAGSRAFTFLAKNAGVAEKQEKKFKESNYNTALGLQKKTLALQKARESGKSFAIANAELSLASSRGAKEIGKQAEAFKLAGITSIHAWRKMGGDKKWEAVTDGISKIHDPTMRAATAVNILGQGGRALVPYLNNGALSFKHMTALAKKFFPEMKGGRDVFEKMRVTTMESSMAWDSLRYNVGMKLAPVMGKLMKLFAKIGVDIRDGKGIWGELGHIIKDVAMAFKDVFMYFKENQRALELLKPALAAVLAMFVWIKVLKIAYDIKMASLAFKDLGVSMGLTMIYVAAFAIAAYLIITHWKEVSAFFVRMWHGIEQGAEDVWNFLKRWGTLIILPFVGPIPWILQHWKAFSHAFISIFEGIGTAIANVFKGIVNFAIIDPLNAFLDLAHSIYNLIPDPFNVLPEWPIPKIPRLAAGGIVRHSGVAMVGERGPEVLRFPTGARVDPLPGRQHGAGLLGGFQNASGSGDLHVHLELDRREIATAVLREFKRVDARV